MSSKSLELFEWHDLALERICLSETSLELLVAPYSDERNEYDRFVLRLSDYESMELDIKGSPTVRDLISLEIYRTDFEVDEAGLLTGEVDIMPGSSGYWRIRFRQAKWKLEQVGI